MPHGCPLAPRPRPAGSSPCYGPARQDPVPPILIPARAAARALGSHAVSRLTCAIRRSARVCDRKSDFRRRAELVDLRCSLSRACVASADPSPLSLRRSVSVDLARDRPRQPGKAGLGGVSALERGPWLRTAGDRRFLPPRRRGHGPVPAAAAGKADRRHRRRPRARRPLRRSDRRRPTEAAGGHPEIASGRATRRQGALTVMDSSAGRTRRIGAPQVPDGGSARRSDVVTGGRASAEERAVRCRAERAAGRSPHQVALWCWPPAPRAPCSSRPAAGDPGASVRLPVLPVAGCSDIRLEGEQIELAFQDVKQLFGVAVQVRADVGSRHDVRLPAAPGNQCLRRACRLSLDRAAAVA